MPVRKLIVTLAAALALAGLDARADTPATASRLDPYKAFRFRLTWEGREVAGLDHAWVSRAKPSGGAPKDGAQGGPIQKITGINKSTDVTMKRGVVKDQGLADWLNGVRHPGQAAPDAKSQDLELGQYDEAGGLVVRLLLHRCRATDFQTPPDLAAGGGTLKVQSLTLRCEAAERVRKTPTPRP